MKKWFSSLIYLSLILLSTVSFAENCNARGIPWFQASWKSISGQGIMYCYYGSWTTPTITIWYNITKPTNSFWHYNAGAEAYTCTASRIECSFQPN